MTPQPRRDPVKKVIGGSNRHTGSLDDAGWRPLREGFLDVGPCGERQGAGIVEFSTLRRGGLWCTGSAGPTMSSAVRKDGPSNQANAWFSSPRTPAHSSCGGGSPNPDRPPRGIHIALCSRGKGELAGVRDDPGRRTLRMAQVARGEAEHGIVFTSAAFL